MKLILGLLIFLGSCGSDICEGNDFVLENGICAFTNGFPVTKELADIITWATANRVVLAFPEKYALKDIDNFSNVKLSFIAPKLDSDWSGKFSEPERFFPEEETYKITVQYGRGHPDYACFYTWKVYSHELLHLYLATAEEVWGHPTEWFEVSEDEEFNPLSVESHLSMWIYDEICGGDAVK